MPLPRKRRNPRIPGETPQEHIRNAWAMLREAIRILDSIPPVPGEYGYFWVSGKEFEMVRESLEHASRRLSYATEVLEERKNPPFGEDVRDASRSGLSEEHVLSQIGVLLGKAAGSGDIYKAQEHLKDAAVLVGLLRAQVRSGVHVNSPGKTARERAITLLRRRAGGRLRKNPAMLGVLGLNPPPMIDGSVEPIQAMWGEIHYVRPDDPEGKDVVRVHEFEHGFRALPLTDGRVLLESRKDDRLWTVE